MGFDIIYWENPIWYYLLKKSYWNKGRQTKDKKTNEKRVNFLIKEIKLYLFKLIIVQTINTTYWIINNKKKSIQLKNDITLI